MLSGDMTKTLQLLRGACKESSRVDHGLNEGVLCVW